VHIEISQYASCGKRDQLSINLRDISICRYITAFLHCKYLRMESLSRQKMVTRVTVWHLCNRNNKHYECRWREHWRTLIYFTSAEKVSIISYIAGQTFLQLWSFFAYILVAAKISVQIAAYHNIMLWHIHVLTEDTF